jgi:hypothetical protein
LFRFEVLKIIAMRIKMITRLATAVAFILMMGTAAHAQDDAPQKKTLSMPNITPQDLEKFQIMEDSLVMSADSMFYCFIPDARIAYSEKFVAQLVRTLKIPNSYSYPFDSLNKLVNLIYSDDNAFRMFNWEIAPSNVTKRYYGAIQLPSDKLKLIGLNDYSEQLGRGAEDSILSNRKWPGALYYQIISRQIGDKKIYTLFGFNGASTISGKRLLEPMAFVNGGVQFGAPIFAIASETNPQHRINRFILEFKKGVKITLAWDKEKNAIVFDKLVSQVNDPRRKYTYVPSGNYDGLIWENNSWNYVPNFIPVTILKDGQEPPPTDGK